jgi:prepilin-type N-terminal cleavage/methylation domain-containing protein
MLKLHHICPTSPVRRRCSFLPVLKAGHSLIELLVVLSLLGIALAVGTTLLARGTSTVEARGAAQTWQAAATWAQTGSVWLGTVTDLEFDSGRIAVRAEGEGAGGDLGAAAPAAVAVPNVAHWKQGDGVDVRFGAGTAYPSSAGSVYFRCPAGDYRVTVRLESGLTVRTQVEAAP